jgi:uncharacterized membrane protein
MEALVVLIVLAVLILVPWLFYQLGAAIAEGKGRPRSLGWWAVFFGIPAIIVLALLPHVSNLNTYIPPAATPRRKVSEQIERLSALKEKGALTEAEFEREKRALLERS